MITVQQLPVITTSLNDVMNDNHIINGLFTSPMAGQKIIIEGSLTTPYDDGLRFIIHNILGYSNTVTNLL